MKKKGQSHLPAPPVGCPCPDNGPILAAPPKTSSVTNQYICIFFNHINHHTYFKSSYVHIQVFHILHHHTMKLSQAFESFLSWRLIVKVGTKPIRNRPHDSAMKTNSLRSYNSAVKTGSL
jgi:hypothetical protein